MRIYSEYDQTQPLPRFPRLELSGNQTCQTSSHNHS